MQPATPPDEQPVARRRAALDGQRVTASIYRVHRNGEVSVINLKLTSDNRDPLDGGFSIQESLNDHNPELSAKQKTAPDGLRLIDGENKKAYLPATTGDGQCLCSPLSTRSPAWDRQTEWWVSVTFAAPPASVQSVDVSIPVFGTVSDVPVV